MSRLKKTAVFFKGGGYTKGELCSLIGINPSTLSLWIKRVKLPLESSGRAPNDQPLSIKDVLVVLYAWVAIHTMQWGYSLYYEKVVCLGKARAFEEAFAERTGGGSLSEALELILEEGVIYHSRRKATKMTDSQRMAIEFLTEHLTTKYGAYRDENSRTGDQLGKEREGNSRDIESPRTVVG